MRLGKPPPPVIAEEDSGVTPRYRLSDMDVRPRMSPMQNAVDGQSTRSRMTGIMLVSPDGDGDGDGDGDDDDSNRRA